MDCMTAVRLSKLRSFFQNLGLNGWIVPTADPHASEYVDEHYALRKWLSGFTGSAGTLVVTSDRCALLTDSRYWEQAQRQLEGTEIELVRLNCSYAKAIADWLAQNCASDCVIGIFGENISKAAADKLSSELREKKLFLSILHSDPAAVIWDNRPQAACTEIYEHSVSPRSCAQKLAAAAKALKEKNADWLLTSKLDDIAWVFNLRGSDVPCNPVFYSYALIGSDQKAFLFAALNKIKPELRTKLEQDGVTLCNYQGAIEEIEKILSNSDPCTVLADPEELNASLFEIFPEHVRVIEDINPIELLKAQKTPEEIELIQKAMIKDGVALVRFYAWLDDHIHEGLTEADAAEKLNEFRSELEGFVSLSFETISAFGPNAALPHYQPEGRGAKIEGSGFLLIDSGAQFAEGTTDITRTILVGEAGEQMKADYTSVLRATICLATTIFPEGVSSQAIDAIARRPIWQNTADFGHGTGHGVGFFLNVHEGPQRISYPRINVGDSLISRYSAMLPGMVTSDEPGLYRPGKWGIRIENLLANELTAENEFGRFLRFRTLTLCPIDLRAVNVGALSPEEVRWLNSYHQTVRDTLSPFLDERTAQWLEGKTKDLCECLKKQI